MGDSYVQDLDSASKVIQGQARQAFNGTPAAIKEFETSLTMWGQVPGALNHISTNLVDLASQDTRHFKDASVSLAAGTNDVGHVLFTSPRGTVLKCDTDDAQLFHCSVKPGPDRSTHR